MRHLSLLLLLAGCPPVDDDPDDVDTDPTADLDEDGFTADVDCADSDPLRFPGAVERCNGLDDDCDGELARNEVDGDGDQVLDCTACDDAGFWESTWDLEDAAALKAEIDLLTNGLVQCDYTDARRYMFTQVDKVDGQVEGVYTGKLVDVGSATPDATDLNTEHTWPQSQGADVNPQRCDIHHLYPTDPTANSTRSNHPFDDVVGGVTWSQGGSELGNNAAGDTAFEPRDAHKGNVARSMFYFAAAYGHPLSSTQANRFKAWELIDPVDDRELARSAKIAEYQSHENPFVVCVDMAERVY